MVDPNRSRTSRFWLTPTQVSVVKLSSESIFLLLDSQVTKIRNVVANIFVGLNANLLLQTASEVSFYASMQKVT
jgi:hypothetical protein